MTALTFAIGDIHGCHEPLVELIQKCLAYGRANGTSPDLIDDVSFTFIFVGDYIDRGPDSKGVIDYLMTLAEHYECIFLRGNHEDMFLHDWHNFLYNGGFQTLESYGWCEGHAINPHHAPAVRDNFIPAHHWEWFEATELYHKDALRTYVHAGIDRQYWAMSLQSEQVMLWVRKKFLEDPSMKGGYIVHGHTPQENGMIPMQKPNRINLDTGAVFGGRLTAAVFNDREVEPECILQVDSPKKGPLYVKRDGGIYLPEE